MFIRIFLTAKGKISAQEILNNFFELIMEFINKPNVLKVEPYWKINGQYEVEINATFKKDFCEELINKFLYTIADNWQYFGNPVEEVLASVTMKNCKFYINDIYMINIFFQPLKGEKLNP